jgi:hypothetical protein
MLEVILVFCESIFTSIIRVLPVPFTEKKNGGYVGFITVLSAVEVFFFSLGR